MPFKCVESVHLTQRDETSEEKMRYFCDKKEKYSNDLRALKMEMGGKGMADKTMTNNESLMQQNVTMSLSKSYNYS